MMVVTQQRRHNLEEEIVVEEQMARQHARGRLNHVQPVIEPQEIISA
jgi:hypothetical protein